MLSGLESESRLIEVDLVPIEQPNSDSLLLSPQRPSNNEEHSASEAVDGWSKYKVISVLGQGSYGQVYKVTAKSGSESGAFLTAEKGKQ